METSNKVKRGISLLLAIVMLMLSTNITIIADEEVADTSGTNELFFMNSPFEDKTEYNMANGMGYGTEFYRVTLFWTPKQDGETGVYKTDSSGETALKWGEGSVKILPTTSEGDRAYGDSIDIVKVYGSDVNNIIGKVKVHSAFQSTYDYQAAFHRDGERYSCDYMSYSDGPIAWDSFTDVNGFVTYGNKTDDTIRKYSDCVDNILTVDYRNIDNGWEGYEVLPQSFMLNGTGGFNNLELKNYFSFNNKPFNNDNKYFNTPGNGEDSGKNLMERLARKFGISVDDWKNGIRRWTDNSPMYGAYVMIVEPGIYARVREPATTNANKDEPEHTAYAAVTYADLYFWKEGVNDEGKNYFDGKGIDDYELIKSKYDGLQPSDDVFKELSRRMDAYNNDDEYINTNNNTNGGYYNLGDIQWGNEEPVYKLGFKEGNPEYSSSDTNKYTPFQRGAGVAVYYGDGAGGSNGWGTDYTGLPIISLYYNISDPGYGYAMDTSKLYYAPTAVKARYDNDIPVLDWLPGSITNTETAVGYDLRGFVLLNTSSDGGVGGHLSFKNTEDDKEILDGENWGILTNVRFEYNDTIIDENSIERPDDSHLIKKLGNWKSTKQKFTGDDVNVESNTKIRNIGLTSISDISIATLGRLGMSASECESSFKTKLFTTDDNDETAIVNKNTLRYNPPEGQENNMQLILLYCDEACAGDLPRFYDEDIIDEKGNLLYTKDPEYSAETFSYIFVNKYYYRYEKEGETYIDDFDIGKILDTQELKIPKTVTTADIGHDSMEIDTTISSMLDALSDTTINAIIAELKDTWVVYDNAIDDEDVVITPEEDIEAAILNTSVWINDTNDYRKKAWYIKLSNALKVEVDKEQQEYANFITAIEHGEYDIPDDNYEYKLNDILTLEDTERQKYWYSNWADVESLYYGDRTDATKTTNYYTMQEVFDRITNGTVDKLFSDNKYADEVTEDEEDKDSFIISELYDPARNPPYRVVFIRYVNGEVPKEERMTEKLLPDVHYNTVEISQKRLIQSLDLNKDLGYNPEITIVKPAIVVNNHQHYYYCGNGHRHSKGYCEEKIDTKLYNEETGIGLAGLKSMLGESKNHDTFPEDINEYLYDKNLRYMVESTWHNDFTNNNYASQGYLNVYADQYNLNNQDNFTGIAVEPGQHLWLKHLTSHNLAYVEAENKRQETKIKPDITLSYSRIKLGLGGNKDIADYVYYDEGKISGIPFEIDFMTDLYNNNYIHDRLNGSGKEGLTKQKYVRAKDRDKGSRGIIENNPRYVSKSERIDNKWRDYATHPEPDGSDGGEKFYLDELIHGHTEVVGLLDLKQHLEDERGFEGISIESLLKMDEIDNYGFYGDFSYEIFQGNYMAGYLLPWLWRPQGKYNDMKTEQTGETHWGNPRVWTRGGGNILFAISANNVDDHNNYLFGTDSHNGTEYVRDKNGYSWFGTESLSDYRYSTYRTLGGVSSPKYCKTGTYREYDLMGDKTLPDRTAVYESITVRPYSYFGYKNIGNDQPDSANNQSFVINGMEFNNGTNGVTGYAITPDNTGVDFLNTDAGAYIGFFPYIEMLYDTQVWVPIDEEKCKGNDECLNNEYNGNIPVSSDAYSIETEKEYWLNRTEGHVHITRDLPVYILAEHESKIVPNDYIQIGYRHGTGNNKFNTTTGLVLESQQWSTHQSALNLAGNSNSVVGYNTSVISPSEYKDTAVLPGGAIYRLRTASDKNNSDIERTKIGIKNYLTVVPTDVAESGAIEYGASLYSQQKQLNRAVAFLSQVKKSLNSLDIVQVVKNGTNETMVDYAQKGSQTVVNNQSTSSDDRYWLKQGNVDGTMTSTEVTIPPDKEGEAVKKYNLITGGNSNAINEGRENKVDRADLDITGETYSVDIYRIASDIDGNVVVTKTTHAEDGLTMGTIIANMDEWLRKTKPKRQDNKLLINGESEGQKNQVAWIGKIEGIDKLLNSDELKDVDSKTKLFTNYLNSIDRDKGYDPTGLMNSYTGTAQQRMAQSRAVAGEATSVKRINDYEEGAVKYAIGANSDAHWYNEAFDGIAVIVLNTVIEVGFNEEPIPDDDLNKVSRVAVLDPKLQPVRTGQAGLFDTGIISYFRTNATTNVVADGILNVNQWVNFTADNSITGLNKETSKILMPDYKFGTEGYIGSYSKPYVGDKTSLGANERIDVMLDLKSLYRSKDFIIPNVSVMDLY